MKTSKNRFVTVAILASLTSINAAWAATALDSMDVINSDNAADTFNSMSDAELQSWMLGQASQMEQVPAQLHQQGVELSPEAKQSFQAMADQIRVGSTSPDLRMNILKSVGNAGLTVLKVAGYALDTAADILLVAPSEFISNSVTTGISGINNSSVASGTAGDITGAVGAVGLTTAVAIALNPAAVFIGVGAGVAVQSSCLSGTTDFCNTVSVIDRSIQDPAGNAGNATGNGIHTAAVAVGDAAVATGSFVAKETVYGAKDVAYGAGVVASGTVYVAREAAGGVVWEGSVFANSVGDDAVNVRNGIVSVAHFTVRSGEETGSYVGTEVKYVVTSPGTIPRDVGRGVLKAGMFVGNETVYGAKDVAHGAVVVGTTVAGATVTAAKAVGSAAVATGEFTATVTGNALGAVKAASDHTGVTGVLVTTGSFVKDTAVGLGNAVVATAKGIGSIFVRLFYGAKTATVAVGSAVAHSLGLANK
jgi:hypothetical protein